MGGLLLSDTYSNTLKNICLLYNWFMSWYSLKLLNEMWCDIIEITWILLSERARVKSQVWHLYVSLSFHVLISGMRANAMHRLLFSLHFCYPFFHVIEVLRFACVVSECHSLAPVSTHMGNKRISPLLCNRNTTCYIIGMFLKIKLAYTLCSVIPFFLFATEI